MSDIKPVSSYEPVYRCKVLETLSWLYFENEPKRQFAVVETLYPAAAYEALQKELGYSKMAADAEAEFANEYKAKFEALKAENEALRKHAEEIKELCAKEAEHWQTISTNQGHACGQYIAAAIRGFEIVPKNGDSK